MLALYTYMERKGYDFYENTVMDGAFKRLVKVVSLGVNGVLSDLPEGPLPNKREVVAEAELTAVYTAARERSDDKPCDASGLQFSSLALS